MRQNHNVTDRLLSYGIRYIKSVRAACNRKALVKALFNEAPSKSTTSISKSQPGGVPLIIKDEREFLDGQNAFEENFLASVRIMGRFYDAVQLLIEPLFPEPPPPPMPLSKEGTDLRAAIVEHMKAEPQEDEDSWRKPGSLDELNERRAKYKVKSESFRTRLANSAFQNEVWGSFYPEQQMNIKSMMSDPQWRIGSDTAKFESLEKSHPSVVELKQIRLQEYPLGDFGEGFAGRAWGTVSQDVGPLKKGTRLCYKIPENSRHNTMPSLRTAAKAHEEAMGEESGKVRLSFKSGRLTAALDHASQQSSARERGTPTQGGASRQPPLSAGR